MIRGATCGVCACGGVLRSLVQKKFAKAACGQGGHSTKELCTNGACRRTVASRAFGGEDSTQLCAALLLDPRFHALCGSLKRYSNDSSRCVCVCVCGLFLGCRVPGRTESQHAWNDTPFAAVRFPSSPLLMEDMQRADATTEASSASHSSRL